MSGITGTITSGPGIISLTSLGVSAVGVIYARKGIRSTQKQLNEMKETLRDGIKIMEEDTKNHHNSIQKIKKKMKEVDEIYYQVSSMEAQLNGIEENLQIINEKLGIEPKELTNVREVRVNGTSPQPLKSLPATPGKKVRFNDEFSSSDRVANQVNDRVDGSFKRNVNPREELIPIRNADQAKMSFRKTDRHKPQSKSRSSNKNRNNGHLKSKKSKEESQSDEEEKDVDNESEGENEASEELGEELDESEGLDASEDGLEKEDQIAQMMQRR